MSLHSGLVEFVTSSRFVAASLVFVAGLVVGYVLSRLTYRVLSAVGLPETVEGTAFERTTHGLGTSTVGVLAQLVGLAFYVGGALGALNVLGLLNTEAVLPFLAEFLPQVFIATLAVIAGLVVGDKAALVVSERLRGIKLPEVGILPTLVKYSIFYIAALIALSQVGVATSALLVMLFGYVFAVVVFTAVALQHLLRAGAAGAYLLLNEPFSIGDRVRVGDRAGIVQEMDLFVTHIEDEGEEYILPNSELFRSGVVRVRD